MGKSEAQSGATSIAVSARIGAPRFPIWLHLPAQTGIPLPGMASKAEDMTRLIRSMRLKGAAAALILAMAGQVLVARGQALAQAPERGWVPFKIPALTPRSRTPAPPPPPAPSRPRAPR